MATSIQGRMTTPLQIAVLVCAGTFALQAQANEALANKSGCLGCHAVATKLVGPAYKDVAAKYAGQADAQAMLAQSIRNGSVGKWGELPMPAHPKLSDADVKKLAAWVLSAK
ncbi:MAG: cytochrome C' [Betaproteobacteria bacterium]|nr:cytochrome C' [Betaproteobacteria bacterium]